VQAAEMVIIQMGDDQQLASRCGEPPSQLSLALTRTGIDDDPSAFILQNHEIAFVSLQHLECPHTKASHQRTESLPSLCAKYEFALQRPQRDTAAPFVHRDLTTAPSTTSSAPGASLRRGLNSAAKATPHVAGRR
jgi:hypothetical protein